MTTYGAVVVGRNDDYGKNLIERASYSLYSLVSQMDEVIFVDWATEEGKLTLVEEIGIKSPNFYYIKITPEQARKWNNDDPDAQSVCEVMARNIGLRRLSTDVMISTNPDVIPPYRKYLEKTVLDGIFMTVARRNISLYDIRPIGKPQEVNKIMDELEIKKHGWGQEPDVEVCEGDHFSLVSCPGDFQIAPRNVWYKIRGFEESLNGRGYADSNVQRKAFAYRYGILASRDIPVWHIGHERGGGGDGKVNDMHKAIFMERTENPSTWGHINEPLEMRQ
jgi:hypothetical protein